MSSYISNWCGQWGVTAEQHQLFTVAAAPAASSNTLGSQLSTKHAFCVFTLSLAAMGSQFHLAFNITDIDFWTRHKKLAPAHHVLRLASLMRRSPERMATLGL